MKTHSPNKTHLRDIAAATRIAEPTTMTLEAFLQRFDGQLATGGKEMGGQMYETYGDNVMAVHVNAPIFCRFGLIRVAGVFRNDGLR